MTPPPRPWPDGPCASLDAALAEARATPEAPPLTPGQAATLAEIAAAWNADRRARRISSPPPLTPSECLTKILEATSWLVGKAPA